MDWQKRWFASSRLASSPTLKYTRDDRELEFCAHCLLNYGQIGHTHECQYCYSKYIISAVDKRNIKPASKYWHSRAG